MAVTNVQIEPVGVRLDRGCLPCWVVAVAGFRVPGTGCAGFEEGVAVLRILAMAVGLGAPVGG